jgi:CPA1 family monovalent cation:H+ antiporter
MVQFEALVGFLLAAVLLAALARRVGAPYPAFLALGGAILAFVPGVPSFSVQPELALALFVAPVLLDAAYDTSPRDLRDNWVPVAGLVIVSVALTTAAVAFVVRAPGAAMPWAAAVALGAVVRASGRPPRRSRTSTAQAAHRILTILEGGDLRWTTRARC